MVLQNNLQEAFKPIEEKPLKNTSLDVRNDPRTQFLQKLSIMNDKVKIYRRAFYFKDPVFEKETDDIIQKVDK